LHPKKLKEHYSFVDSYNFHQIQKEFTVGKQVSSLKISFFAGFSIISTDARYFLGWWPLVFHHQNGKKKDSKDLIGHGLWEIETLKHRQACGFSYRIPN